MNSVDATVINKINQIFGECGMSCIGFCPFDAIRDHLLECRAKSRVPQKAAGVISVLFPYYLGEDTYEESNISRYAVVSDYHTIVLAYLNKAAEKLKQAFPEEEFVPFVDNSPVPEVQTAALCGLGRVGQNGRLIHPEYGSWVFIGEIITTLPLPQSREREEHCVSCGKCVRACPTGTLTTRDFTSCLSKITQKKGELTSEEVQLIKDHQCAWGCDRCQLVCPENRQVKVTDIKEFKIDVIPKAERGMDIKGRAFAWRGEKVIERNLKIIEKD